MKKAALLATVLLCVGAAAVSCGPAGGDSFRTLFITLSGLQSDVTRLAFLVTTDSGSFVGDTGECQRGGIINPAGAAAAFEDCDPERDVCAEVTQEDQLDILIEHNTADGMDRNDLIILCRFKPVENIDPEFTVEIRECKRGNNNLNGCNVNFDLSTAPVCGNNEVEGNEDCDEGGETEDCDADCTDAECGDSQVNETAGEECEVDEDTPASVCEECLFQCVGGDPNGNEEEGEECDDGNSTTSDDCTNECREN